jgi:hypothetical protein
MISWMPDEDRRRWAAAAMVTLITAVLLLLWTYHWLGDGRYGGVATIDETINRRTQQPAPEITSSVRLTQTFLASDDGLTSIQLFFGTYMRRNTADVVVAITDERGRTVLQTELAAASIVDNAYRTIGFDRLQHSRGVVYEVSITSPEGRPGNAFTAWTGNCDCYPEGEFLINGAQQADRELVMRVSYHHDNVTTWRELLDRMSQYKPLIFKGVGLVLLALIATAFSLAALALFTSEVLTPKRSVPLESANMYWIAAAIVASLIVLAVTGAYEGI